MADPSPNAAPQAQADPGRKGNTNASLTPEQVQAVAERVYAMLLRDLKQDRERYHVLVRNSGMFKRG
jgi:hypothetical protein